MTTTIQPREGLYPTGRKFCSRCKCWRHLYEFGPSNQDRNPGVLRSHCSTCERVRQRIQAGIRNRGRPYAQAQPYGPTPQSHCGKGHPMEGDNLIVEPSGKRRCRTCYRAWQHSPERLEYQRIWTEVKRREAGIPPRNIHRPCPKPDDERVMIPVEPFAEWLDKLTERFGAGEVARMTQVGTDGLDRYRTREHPTAHIDIVDRALVSVGEKSLLDLYPELYEFEEAA